MPSCLYYFLGKILKIPFKEFGFRNKKKAAAKENKDKK